jgi:thiol:disulfide interchange protein
MAKITIVTGVLLILLGLACYLYTGHQYPTSLIPSAFGILLVAFGSMAETPVQRRRMLAMHIAVTVGLLGFLATAAALVSVVQLIKGKLFPYPIAIEEKAAMSVLLLIYVLLCVRSFIVARRSRV